MIQIEKEKCCGCTACASVCPKNAIQMKPDFEGFLYPDIEIDKCVGCGLCEQVCPVSAQKDNKGETKGYIARHRDTNIVKNSTSGGIFTALAEAVISDGGVVYGAGYDKDMRVVCKKAASMEDLLEMRGSKFVQSDLGKVFCEIKHELVEGTKILYSGTPCQIGGLLSYLGKKPDNLFCVDFVCRGVPSPKLWGNYISVMEKKFHSKVIGAKFKNKTYGYHATTMKIDFANGRTYYGSGRIDPMMKAFVTEMASRPSCGNCSFKHLHRNSDITMFDCYNYSLLTGLYDDNKGWSSVLVHSRLGSTMFERICADLVVHEAIIEDLVRENGIMVYNSAKPNAKREKFFELVDTHPIDEAMQEVNPVTVLDRIVEISKIIVYRCGLLQIIKGIREKCKTIE